VALIAGSDWVDWQGNGFMDLAELPARQPHRRRLRGAGAGGGAICRRMVSATVEIVMGTAACFYGVRG